MTDEIQAEEPPAHVMFRIWFAMFWRSWLWMLPVVLASVTAAALTAIVGDALGFNVKAITRFWSVLGYLIGPVGIIWANIQATRAVLGGTYGGWRLSLEKRPEGY